MKKLLVVIAMVFGVVIRVFGLNTEESALIDNPPVVTGGWQEIDVSELDEGVKNFVLGYLEGFIPNTYAYPSYNVKVTGWIIDRVWSQLIQGRRYLIPYYVLQETTGNEYPASDLPSILGLIVLRRTPDGSIFLEKEYNHMTMPDFIELMLTGEIRKRDFPKNSIIGGSNYRR
jgi:hypothetical protein